MGIIGYLVREHAEDFEQVLGLRTGPALPPGGVLEWTNGPRAVFPTRQAARDAIRRTEHYRLAFGGTDAPEAKYCDVLRLRAVTS